MLLEETHTILVKLQSLCHNQYWKDNEGKGDQWTPYLLCKVYTTRGWGIYMDVPQLTSESVIQVIKVMGTEV